MASKQSETPEQLEAPVAVPLVALKDARLYEGTNNRWRILMPHGFTAEMAKDAAAVEKSLIVVASQLRAFDETMLVAADASWVCGYLICDSGVGFVQALYMYFAQMPPRHSGPAERVPPGFDIIRDPIEGTWTVVRLEDNHKFNNIRAVTRRDALDQLLNSARFQNSEYGASKAAIV